MRVEGFIENIPIDKHYEFIDKFIELVESYGGEAFTSWDAEECDKSAQQHVSAEADSGAVDGAGLNSIETINTPG